jgi:hypothetical protein
MTLETERIHIKYGEPASEELYRIVGIVQLEMLTERPLEYLCCAYNE